jgi:hypothetical protein
MQIPMVVLHRTVKSVVVTTMRRPVDVQHLTA